MNKILVVTTEKRYSLNSRKEIVNEDNTRSKKFWERYLDVFDEIIVVARVNRTKISEGALVESSQISVYPITDYHGLVQGVLSISTIKNELRQLVQQYENSSFLLRVPGETGNMLAKELIKRWIPFSLEIVGNPYEVFKSKRTLLGIILALRGKRELQVIVDKASSVSYVTQKYLQKHYPFRGKYQTHYSDIILLPDFFINKNEFSEPVLSIIGVGNLEMPYKGVLVLLEALKRLDNRDIPFTLTWVGSGRLMKKYERFLEKHNLCNKIKFVGSVPNEELPLYLSKHNIFILPSLTEGLPRALIEAKAAGLICVGSNVGGIPELIPEFCLFPPNSDLAIYKKLKDVHLNFNKYLKTSSSNFEEANNYRPEVLNARRKSFLKSIISKNEL